MNIPENLHYTSDHEWLRVENSEGVVGITDYAQSELGDIVYVDLPDVGKEIFQGKPFGTIEAVKAAAELFAPVTGEIIAVNGLLEQHPELINRSPYEDGWIIKVKMRDAEEVDTLLTPNDYRQLITKLKG
ncbi:MAG: glycine cleavage system protein GcvH [bacterium]